MYITWQSLNEFMMCGAIVAVVGLSLIIGIATLLNKYVK